MEKARRRKCGKTYKRKPPITTQTKVYILLEDEYDLVSHDEIGMAFRALTHLLEPPAVLTHNGRIDQHEGKFPDDLSHHTTELRAS